MNVVPLRDPHRWRREKADELGFSAREMMMVEAIEKIATGTAGQGAGTDLEIVRDIAFETLEKVGWPTVAKKKTPAA